MLHSNQNEPANERVVGVMECWSDETQYSDAPLVRSPVARRLPASWSSPHLDSY
jgi:hypothetical protein